MIKMGIYLLHGHYFCDKTMYANVPYLCACVKDFSALSMLSILNAVVIVLDVQKV
jgi:hypothetical protein